MAGWIQKQDPYILCLQETHFRPNDTHKLKVRGWKNIFHANGKQKKAGVAIIILEKMDLKIKKITRDKEKHYIKIKGSIQEEDIAIVSIYAHNIGAPQYTRQTLTDIKGEIDSNTIIVGDFNTLLTPMDRSSKQKINKETQVLNDTLDEMDLIDIIMTFHPNAEEYTFSSAHGTFSRIDHILGHKSNLRKLKKIEIVPRIFSNHNAMRLDINYRKKKSVRNTNTWRLNNTFLNNQQVTEEIKKKITKFLERNDNENMTIQNLWDAAIAVLRGKFIAMQSDLKKQEKH